MAQVIINSGTRILPTGIPEHVDAKRDLESILIELRNLHKQFMSVDLRDKYQVNGFQKRIAVIQDKYQEVLRKCEESLEKLTEGSEKQRQYYFPLMRFLFRASNAHSILPFSKYLKLQADNLDIGKEGNIFTRESPVTLSDYHDFISMRISEASDTCDSYITLLSQTLNKPIEKTDLNGLVGRALRIARRRAQLQSMYCYLNEITRIQRQIRDKNPGITWQEILVHSDLQEYEKRVRKENVKIFEQIETSTSMYNSFYGEIYSIPSLVFFYLVNTFGNHFKAAHQIYYKAKEDSSEYFQRFQEPRLDVKVELFNDEYVQVTSTDTGCGMNKGFLNHLFDEKKPRYMKGVIYPSMFIVGNGSTLKTYPLICDMLHAIIEAKSQGPYKGAEFRLILPRDLEKPGKIPEELLKV